MTTKCIHPRPFICVRDHRLALLASSRTDMDVTASRMENTLALFSRSAAIRRDFPNERTSRARSSLRYLK